jgi:hypothetical protein
MEFGEVKTPDQSNVICETPLNAEWLPYGPERQRAASTAWGIGCAVLTRSGQLARLRFEEWRYDDPILSAIGDTFLVVIAD